MKTGPMTGRRIWPPWLWPESIRSIPHRAALANVVGRVAEQDPEVGLGHRSRVEPGPQGAEVPPRARVGPRSSSVVQRPSRSVNPASTSAWRILRWWCSWSWLPRIA